MLASPETASLARHHTLVLSAAILDEVERVLYYPRLLRMSKLRPEQIAQYVEFLSFSSALVEMDDTISVPIKDPQDVHVIQTAVSGTADVICTLDAHFYGPIVISFCEQRGIKILKDIDLLPLIRQAVE